MRAELEDFQNEKSTWTDEAHAKMVKLNDAEIKMKQERDQLDLAVTQHKHESARLFRGMVAEFSFSAAQLKAREEEWNEVAERRTAEMNSRDAALLEMSKKVDKEKSAIEDARRSLENREQALAQNKQDFEAEKQRYGTTGLRV